MNTDTLSVSYSSNIRNVRPNNMYGCRLLNGKIVRNIRRNIFEDLNTRLVAEDTLTAVTKNVLFEERRSSIKVKDTNRQCLN